MPVLVQGDALNLISEIDTVMQVDLICNQVRQVDITAFMGRW